MTPRAFLRGLLGSPTPDERGEARLQPLQVHPGETVGVVLLNTGGPACPDDVEAFLYSRLMDPAETDWPVPAPVRQWATRIRARRRARDLQRAYELIGGSSPLSHHTREQARALERRLNDRFGALTGARFRTYTAMRHGQPSAEDAARAMAEDGVTQVVLLPLHPHYAGTTTGSSLTQWSQMETAGTMPVWPTTEVLEYAAHPKYVQAVAERVDEGLQRFPREVRHRVQVLFCAQGALQGRVDKARDPYCCLVHATVQQVMEARAGHDPERGVHVAFGEPLTSGRALAPEVRDTIHALADDGYDAVLIVPISYVSDRIETAYELDVVVREQATTAGMVHFEVTNGLNGHPLFVEALAECAAAQLLPHTQGDGAATLVPSPLVALPRHDAALRSIRCDSCTFVAEPCDWSGEAAVRVPAPPSAEAA